MMYFIIALLCVVSVEANSVNRTKRQSCPEHDIVIYNNCPFTVWAAVHSPIQPSTNNGFRLNTKQKQQIRVPCRWEAARIWARTNCNADGRNCETGDCNAMKCVGAG
ncbi:hypothetical protein B4U80_08587, partial [Leptotrombidium deliense]